MKPGPLDGTDKIHNGSLSRFGSVMLNWRSISLLVGSILLGVTFALLLMSQIFVSIPTDVRRLGIIFQSFAREDNTPAIAVFGNSVIMSGIDARALSTEISQHPVAWNCATTGQKIAESFLLTQELPKSVDLAVYGIQISPGQQKEIIHPQKFNTLYMYGFRPNDDTISTLHQVHGDDAVYELLTRSTLHQIFYSRWAIRQFVDTRTRSMLRPDLALDKATFDLYHPQTYETTIDASIVEKLVRAQNNAYRSKPAITAQGDVELAIQIAREGHALGRRTVFLFAPVHPAILRENGPQFEAVVSSFKDAVGAASSATTVNFLDLLKSQDFIDDRHPTNDGARTLTAALAKALMAD